MQELADAVIIDAECQTTNTVYGAVFLYGEEHGIQARDILPLGARRREFEFAYKRRMDSTTHEEICGSLQARYRQLFPLWFRTR